MVINLGLRFLLEIVALIGVGYWGFHSGESTFMRFLLGIGGPILLAIIWGTFGSPAAPFRLEEPHRIWLEIIIFGLSVLAVYLSGHPYLALIFAIGPLLFV